MMSSVTESANEQDDMSKSLIKSMGNNKRGSMVGEKKLTISHEIQHKKDQIEINSKFKLVPVSQEE